MRVSGIDNRYNQSFNGIVTSPYAKFSKVQDKICKNIVKNLRTNVKELDNATAEDFYKNKYNLDFLISPEKGDRVSLRGITDLGYSRNGDLTYSRTFKIGDYGSNPRKNTLFENIDEFLGKKRDKDQRLNILGWGIVVGMMYVAALFSGPNSQPGPEQRMNEKAIIENVDTLKVDTLKKGADTVFADTAKVLKKVK